MHADDSDPGDDLPRIYRDGVLVRGDRPEGRPPPRGRAGHEDAHHQRLLDVVAQEKVVSARRRRLHHRIEFLAGQGATDELTLDQIAHLRVKERVLSDARRELHHEIGRLRAQLVSTTSPRIDGPAGGRVS